ncbi:MAG: cyclase family protein [Candidatus Humimicrobiaceae bacterium]
MRKIIDLSMEVSKDMVTFYGIPKPIFATVESHEDYARNVGATDYGVKSLTKHDVVILSDHAGTHIDALYHINKTAGTAETIPLEYCYGDGVLLDFSNKPVGYGITDIDVKKELKRIGYALKPLDIVLIKTGASRNNKNPKYLTDHCGMTRESTLYLIEEGIKVMGIDAPTFDIPKNAMFEKKKFWEAHLVMNEKEYYHIENMDNLNAIPKQFDFKVSVFPIKWKGTTAAPVRAVAIIEE